MPSDIDSFGQCFHTVPLFPDYLGLIAVSLVCIAGALWIIRQKTSFGRRFLNIALWGMLIWIVAIGMKAVSDTPACQVLWSRMSYVGVGLLPPAWFLFAYRYATGESGRMKLWQRTILIGTIALAIGVTWTNQWHFLFYGPGSGHVNPVTKQTIITKGPLYWPLVWYFYSYILCALVVFAYCIYRSYGAFRLHFVVLVMLTLLPTSVSLAYTHLNMTLWGVNPTPYVIVLVLVMYVYLIADNEVSQTASLAKEQIFLDIPNPMLAIARSGRLSLANYRAVELFDIPAPHRDMEVSEIPRLAAIAALVQQHAGNYTTELTIGERIFEIHASDVIRPLGRGDPVLGRLVMFFDVTERRHSNTTLADELSEALRQNRRIMDEAVTDPLTGLHNRRALEPAFERLCHETAEGAPLTLTIIDLDHFKAINDSYGHATGDLALTILAEGMHRAFRAEDGKFRIGGEEFVILSAHIDLAALRFRLDQLRQWVLAEGKRRGPEGLTICFSAGVAVQKDSCTTLGQLLTTADARLYAAKMAGRNRTVGPDTPPAPET